MTSALTPAPARKSASLFAAGSATCSRPEGRTGTARRALLCRLRRHGALQPCTRDRGLDQPFRLYVLGELPHERHSRVSSLGDCDGMPFDAPAAVEHF